MKLAKVSGQLGLAMLAATTGSLAVAQAPDSGWYLGGNVGRSEARIDDSRITSGLRGQGLISSTIEDRDRDVGYKLFGGYQLNRNLAVEAGFFDLGEFGYTATTVPPGSLTGDMRVRGLNLDLVGILPFGGSGFSLLGRVGANYASVKDNFSASGAARVPYSTNTPSKRETNPKVGIGVMYNFTDSLGMRLEAERFKINDAVGNRGRIKLYSIGLVYRFGAAPAPAPRATVAPAPVPVAQAPAPIVAAAPPPAPPPPVPRVPTRVNFAADSLFDFDKSVVKPEGKQALDKFAGDLRGTSYDAINVTGHTDRLGSHDYNMKLSGRRAQAVRTYLVDSAAVPASKITASGVDGANPVTKPGECKGTRPTPALIACLQPDRRVEVEVSGTR
jgi:OOP family OmpA-OmpF porin